MLGEGELAKLLVSWKNQLGEEIKGRFCVPIDRQLRIDMFKHLIETLIRLHSYEQDDFEGNTYRRIMEASINPNSERKDKWREAATADWNDALDSFFPQKIIFHTPKPETSEYERPVSGRGGKTSVPEHVDEIAPEDLLDKSKIESGIAAPDYAIDEEFLKQLQGDSDE